MRVDLGQITLNVESAGQGPTLLLVHGFPLDHSMWKRQLAELADEFCVVAPDLRGAGQSDVTAGVVTMQQFADDLALLLDKLPVTQPVTLCGLSMGGYIAWQFLERHRAKLAKLILCDTKAAADSPDTARNRLATAQQVLHEGAQAIVDSMMPKLFADLDDPAQAENVKAIRRSILGSQPEGVAAASRGMAERPDFTSRLGSIDLPTLVICGQHDVITPPQPMQAMAEAIPGAQYVEIPQAGHLAPLENPAAVNAAIRSFLRA